MGVVYEADDVQRGERVALKQLRRIEGSRLMRFKQEFRALADLHHPNLVRLGELFEDAGNWFFTMELIDGADLLGWVRPGSASLEFTASLHPSDDTLRAEHLSTSITAEAMRDLLFDESRVREAFRQLAVGLIALHEAGKVHRDVKPSNVLVTPEGRVVLLDFGLATEIGPGQSDFNVVGTAAYMSPEQAASAPVGPAADWYAFGVVLYEALTGMLPFEGRPLEIMLAKQTNEPKPPRELLSSVPADLDRLCVQLLRRDPESRPTGAQVLRSLGGTHSAPEASALVSHGSAPFVGRQSELAELRDCFERSRTACTMVLVRGTSGIGKTALVRHFFDDVAVPRPLVLAGRCYERESVPYKAFDGVIDDLTRHLRRMPAPMVSAALPRDAPVLARVFPVLREVRGILKTEDARAMNPLEQRSRAFVALRELLTRLARQGPVVVFIDDLQWADADSHLLLREVFHPPAAPPVLILATLRADADAAPPPAVEISVNAITGARQVALSALSDADSTRLLQDLVGSGSDSDIAAITREARGHPLFLHELVRHLEHPTSNRAVRLDDALWSRAQLLEDEPRRILELVAVAGAPVPQEVIARAADVEAGRVARSVALLRVAHLLRSAGLRGTDRVDTYHDRVREAILSKLEPDARKWHHSRIAAALESAPPALQDPRMLVTHLEASGESAAAARHALRAARLSADALAFDQAAEFYRAALRLGSPAADERRALLVGLADCLSHAGRGAEAAEVFLAAVPGADSAQRLEYQRRAAEQLLVTGYIDEGSRVVAALLRELGDEMPSTPRRALMAVAWRRLRVALRGMRWKARDAAQIAPRDLTRLDVYRSVGMALAMVDTVQGAALQARALRMALDLGEPRRVSQSLAVEANFRQSQGSRHFARALGLLEQANTIAQQSGDTFLLGWVEAVGGIHHYFSGRFGQAHEMLSSAVATFSGLPIGSVFEINNARIFLLHTLLRMGRLVDLRAHRDEWVRDAIRRGDRYADTTMTRAFSLLSLADGDPDGLRRLLEQKGWTPPRDGFHLQHWYELRARIEADLYEGKSDSQLEQQLAALSRSLLRRVVTVRSEADWLRARMALIGAQPDAAALRLCEKLAERMEREATSYTSAWAALVRAAVTASSGARELALTQLERAIAESEVSGMRLCATVARWRKGALLGGEAGGRLRADAEAWMTHEGIRDPVRLVEMIAPGFR